MKTPIKLLSLLLLFTVKCFSQIEKPDEIRSNENVIKITGPTIVKGKDQVEKQKKLYSIDFNSWGALRFPLLSGNNTFTGSLNTFNGGLKTMGQLSLNTSIHGYSEGSFLRVSTAGGVIGTGILSADLPSGITAAKIGNGDVDNTKLSYINSLNSNAQIQLDSKVAFSGGTFTGKTNNILAENTAYNATSSFLNSNNTGVVNQIYNTSNSTLSYAGIKLTTRNSLPTSWSILNVNAGLNLGDLVFGYGDATSREVMRLSNTGSLGIGKNPTSGKLDVAGDIYSSTSVVSPIFSSNSLNPYYSLKQNFTNIEWRMRGNFGNGASSSAWNLYNQTTSKYAITAHTDGNVMIGANDYYNETRLGVFGGANGANVDVRGNSGAFVDQSTIELEGNDYDTETRSTFLQYRGSTYTGTSNGFPNNNLARLVMNGDNNLIMTGVQKPLILGTNYVERMRIDSVGNVGIGKTSATEKLDINGNFKVSGTSFMQNIAVGGSITNTTWSEGIVHADESGTLYSGPLYTSEILGLSTNYVQKTGTTFVGDVVLDYEGARIRWKDSEFNRSITIEPESGILFDDYTSTGNYTEGKIKGENLKLYGKNNTGIDIDSLGNIGIGVNEPNEKLHIEGNALIGGHIKGKNNFSYFINQNGASMDVVGDMLGGRIEITTGSTRLSGQILHCDFNQFVLSDMTMVISDGADNFAMGHTNPVYVQTGESFFNLVVKTGLSLEPNQTYIWYYMIKE